jgi:putative nucleotidyltransferase with HDIG domain
VFAGDEPVHDLGNAITRVGLNEIFRLVACVIGEGILGEQQRGYGLARGELARHSIVTAVAAKVIARDLGTDENLVFTAGLLHDVGKLALSAALELSYARVVRQTETAGRSFLEAEEMLLGVNHADAGGRLLERWRFPAPLLHAIRHHHNPLLAPDNIDLATSVHVADLLAHLLGHGYGHHAYAIRAHPEALARLGYAARDIERLILATQLALSETDLLTAT